MAPTSNSAGREQARSPGRRSGVCTSLKSNSTLSLLRKGIYDDPKLASAEFWQGVLQNFSSADSTDDGDGSRPVRSRGDRVAEELCAGAVGYVKWVLRPLLQLSCPSSTVVGLNGDDTLVLLEHVLHFACVVADEMSLRTLVKDLYAMAGDCIGLAAKIFDSAAAERTLVKLALLCLVHLKGGVYDDLCAMEAYQCQSLVENLLTLALGSSRLAVAGGAEEAGEADRWEGDDEAYSEGLLGVYMAVADARLRDIHVCLVWEVVEHIGRIVAGSWRCGWTSQAQQDYNFLEIVSEDKFVPLAVSLVVMRKLEGGEDASRMLIPALIDAVAVQRARLDVSTHVFAVHVLASIGVVCAAHSNFWGFSTALAVLIKLFKYPEHRLSAEMMYGRGGGGGSAGGREQRGSGGRVSERMTDSAGSLSRGLLRLASGIHLAPVMFRKYLRKHMLTLFSDFALLTPNESYVADLGSLLPAVAAAVASIPTSFVMGRISSVLSSGDLSLDALKEIQEEGRVETSAFRHLWFCAAVYDFGSIRSAGGWPSAWSRALCVISSRTPILLIGSEQQQESVFLDHIGAEFGGWLSSLGSRARPKSLLDSLRRTIDNTDTKRSIKPELCCHILTIAYIARLHATVSDVGGGNNDLRVDRSPIDHCIIHAQFSLPGSCEYEWYEDIIQVVFAKYLDRLGVLKASASQDEEAFAVDAAAYTAALLIESLVQQGPNDDIPKLMVHLLQMILPSFPSLFFLSETINGALRAVATEQQMNRVSARSIPLEVVPRTARGGFHTHNGSSNQSMKATTASVYLLDLIRNAASRAPSVIEAIVGETLRHMAVAGVDGDNITSSITPSVMEALQLGQADCSLPDSMGVFRGVIAWSAKIRALGVVHGLMLQGRDGNQVLQQRTRDLIANVERGAPANVICDSILDLAASCVALRDESQAEAPLQLLAWVPLMLVDDDIMKSACLAWHWIIAACPEMAPSLLDGITNAWCSKQNVGIGIFDRDPSTESEDLRNCIDVQRTWIVFWTEIWRSSGDRRGALVVPSGGTAATTAAASPPWNLESHMIRIAESVVGDTDASNLNKEPYSCSTRFRLLNLILEILRASHAIRELKPGDDSLVASRYSDVVGAALSWFAAPVAWIETAPEMAMESYVAVKEFGALLTDMEVYLKELGIKIVTKERTDLLAFLIDVEMDRLKLWTQPASGGAGRGGGRAPAVPVPKRGWASTAEAAWNESPSLALAIGARFAGVESLHIALQQLVIRDAEDETAQGLSEAVKYMLAAPPSAAKSKAMERLSVWSPMGLEHSMSLMSQPIARERVVFGYIIRCLERCDPNEVSFFLPQLVQLLRHDPDKGVETFLLNAASRSPYFAFLLKCQLLSEGTPPDEAFAPEVKRAGWQPPSDTGLWTVADSAYHTLLNSLKGQVREHLDAESKFFDEVTEVSGKLYPVPKDERKAAAVDFLSGIAVSRDDLFMPFCPDTVIKGVKPETAAPMQSAAKCPILVAFDVEDRKASRHGDAGRRHSEDRASNANPESSEARGILKVEAAIFKVGDDCRQDVLALQVAELVKRKFDDVGLPLPLVPYGVIPTGYECGIIQVVPNAKSRAQLGEVTDGGLLDVFQHEFGLPGSARFEAARQSLIESSAAYAVVSYLLQAKDRHNGNIMIDNAGRLIHIDFGFIFGISPGGNMGFESAAFKLSYEMTELLDPGNTRRSVHFLRFQELCIKGYLAARMAADSIVATVEMMLPSKLPCFSRGAPVASLRDRFHLEMSDQQAAEFMRGLINDAYDKWTTGVYDLIQYYQNQIPK